MQERLISKNRDIVDSILITLSGAGIAAINSFVEKDFVPDNVGKLGAVAAVVGVFKLISLLSSKNRQDTH